MTSSILVSNNIVIAPTSTVTDATPSDAINPKTVTTTIGTSGDVTKPVAVVWSSTLTTTSTEDDSKSESYCEQTKIRDIEWGPAAAGTTVYKPCPNTLREHGQ